MNRVPPTLSAQVPLGTEPPGATAQAAAPPLTDLAASELLVQLGHEYFSVASPLAPADSQHSPGAKSVTPEPRDIARAAPPGSPARDFWEDVATVSERGHDWAPNGLGLRCDPVAHAIATVSASYALGAEKRAHVPAPSVNHQHLHATPKEQPRTLPESSSSARPSASAPDFVDALVSLFGLEELAGLSEVRNLAPQTFTRYRELAASALLAADTNRASALKAAEGRRG